MTTKPTGFIPPKIDNTHYVLGASPMPYKVFREDGNWFGSRPQKEYQSKGFDTFNCTGFNTLAQIEAFMKEAHGLDVEYSDRWLGIIAGTRPPGNDPQAVYEAIRKHGLIPDSMLPFSDEIQSVEEYYSFKGANEAVCRAEGKKWLEQWDFFHEWVVADGNTPEEKVHNMKVALKSSPLSLAVYAWAQDENGVYIKLGPENHWTFEYAHDLYGKIEDSYEPTLKDVNQDINFCKRIYIAKKETKGIIKQSFWLRAYNWIINLLTKKQ